MEKIWIAGAKGHVGSALCDLLDCRHYEILPTDLEEVDITDRESVSNYVRVSRPDVLINCVGFGDIASCEAQPDKAYQVNTVGARNLAVQAQAIGAKLIHLSTDDVFSHHARQPYNEFESTGTGFSFANYNAHEMLGSVRYAKFHPLPPFMKKVNLQESVLYKISVPAMLS